MTSNASLSEISDRLRQFVLERDWSKFHDPKNLAMAVAAEAGELLAELRWVSSKEADAFVRDPVHGASIETEVADIAIALLLFCDRAGIDLFSAIERKIEVNRHNYPVDLSRGRSERPESDWPV